MHAIVPSLLSSSGRALGAEPGNSTSVSRLNQVQAETHTSTDFAFVTAEGDKVTLSTDSLAQAVYTSYDARGRLRGQRLDVHAETLQLTAAQQSALSIEGDLSQAELADIQQVLDTISELASDFFAGELDKPLSQAFDLDEFDTLSSVDATLEYSQHLTVSQLTQARVTEAGTPRLPADIAELSEQPLTTTRPQNLLKEILHAVDAAPAEPTRGDAKTTRLLDKLTEKLTRQPDVDTSKQQAFARLASQLLRRLSEGGPAGVPDTESPRQDSRGEAPSAPVA